MKHFYQPIMLLMAFCILLGFPLPASALEGPFVDSGPETDPIVLTAVVPPDGLPVMLPAGAGPETIQSAFQAHHKHLYTVHAQTADGLSVECAVEFDFSKIASPAWGAGALPGIVIPPEGYILGEGVGYSLPYRALKPYRVDLSYFTEVDGGLLFCWPFTVTQPEKLRLSYTKQGQDGFITDKNGDYGEMTATSLLLYCDRLEPGVEYYFRVCSEGFYSNAVAVSAGDWGITARPSSVFPHAKPNFGDQDGGDREEQYIPPVIQPITPAPEESDSGIVSRGAASHTIIGSGPQNASQILAPRPEQTPAPTAETSPDEAASWENSFGTPTTLPAEGPAPLASEPPVTERVTQDSTVLSGYRLRQMLTANGSVSLEKHGILIQLPQTFFDGLYLKDNDLFSCTIQKNTDASFSLELDLSGSPVTQLPPSTVQFPLPDSLREEALAIYSQQGFLAETVPSGGRAVFEITSPGTYRIEAQQVLSTAASYPDAPPRLSDPTPAIPGAFYGITGAVVLCVWLLWERKKR